MSALMTHQSGSFLSLLVCCTQNYRLEYRHIVGSNLEWQDSKSQSDQAKWTSRYRRSDWSIFRPGVGYHTTNQNSTIERRLLRHQRKSFEFEFRFLIGDFQLIELNQGWDQLELLNLSHWKWLWTIAFWFFNIVRSSWTEIQRFFLAIEEIWVCRISLCFQLRLFIICSFWKVQERKNSKV